MLYIFGGLPGCGKTALSLQLARQRAAVHLRIDTIEQALRNAGVSVEGPEGYVVAYRVAADNLRLGLDVVADSVNPLRLTRAAWRDVARAAGTSFVEIEVRCSDPEEHRRRVESRAVDIPWHRLPTWTEVVQREYHAWDEEHIVVDTAGRTLEESVADLERALATHSPTARIILLHGASSSGKSTLSKAIQGALGEPFVHFASDHLAPGLPERNDADGPLPWWRSARPRFFDGFQRCIASLAASGNDLIVDHIIEQPGWRADLGRILKPFDVFLVGVHCSPQEIDRRELVRSDRRVGEGRSHLEDDHIHDFGPYDCDVDTTGRNPDEVAAEVINQWRRRRVSVLFATDE